jgi:hypothetical protein
LAAGLVAPSLPQQRSESVNGASAPPAPPTLPPPPPKATADEAKQLVTPVTGTPAAKPQPDALEPQPAQRRTVPVKRQPPTRKLQPGELVCGDCGEGNPATRKFCSRCGGSLAAAVIVKTPWWRKLLPRRGAKVRKSGDRPKRKGRGGKTRTGVAVSATFKALRRIVAIALLIGGILYGLMAPFRGWVNDRAQAAKSGVEDIFFPDYEPVNESEAPVSPVQDPANPGLNALDGFFDTFWAAPIAGQQPVLVIKFDGPVDLAQLIVHNGDPADFKGKLRAKQLHLVYSTGKTTDVNLTDNPDPQTFELENGEGAEYVEVHVANTFKSVNGTMVALTELEFFKEV